ncbi:hypothetical protein L1N85_14740 [Paenibacillus alkaliterrae]|uniref:hypothetical protein n=1 Tax=Paenibacillus alkaliterrae TaxID=320909 RepID=UPI001F1B60CC|nr:hypothetical protein [Paenibacillus alkaliterrae]MCF2939677.1 hypothetical protein [Paenibacillus alkaliterrae]
MEIGTETSNIYDAASHAYIQTNVNGKTMITIAPDAAVLVVIIPAYAKKSREGTKLLAGGVVIDYQSPNSLMLSGN